jgi:hypothetical protein
MLARAAAYGNRRGGRFAPGGFSRLDNRRSGGTWLSDERRRLQPARKRRRRRLLLTTVTLLRPMAPAAKMGLNKRPKAG